MRAVLCFSLLVLGVSAQFGGFWPSANNGFGGFSNNGFGGLSNNGFGGFSNNGFGGTSNNGFGGFNNGLNLNSLNNFNGLTNQGFQNNNFLQNNNVLAQANQLSQLQALLSAIAVTSQPKTPAVTAFGVQVTTAQNCICAQESVGLHWGQNHAGCGQATVDVEYTEFKDRFWCDTTKLCNGMTWDYCAPTDGEILQRFWTLYNNYDANGFVNLDMLSKIVKQAKGLSNLNAAELSMVDNVWSSINGNVMKAGSALNTNVRQWLNNHPVDVNTLLGLVGQDAAAPAGSTATPKAKAGVCQQYIIAAPSKLYISPFDYMFNDGIATNNVSFMNNFEHRGQQFDCIPNTNKQGSKSPLDYFKQEWPDQHYGINQLTGVRQLVGVVLPQKGKAYGVGYPSFSPPGEFLKPVQMNFGQGTSIDENFVHLSDASTVLTLANRAFLRRDAVPAAGVAPDTFQSDGYCTANYYKYEVDDTPAKGSCAYLSTEGQVCGIPIKDISSTLSIQSTWERQIYRCRWPLVCTIQSVGSLFGSVAEKAGGVAMTGQIPMQIDQLGAAYVLNPKDLTKAGREITRAAYQAYNDYLKSDGLVGPKGKKIKGATYVDQRAASTFQYFPSDTTLTVAQLAAVDANLIKNANYGGAVTTTSQIHIKGNVKATVLDNMVAVAPAVHIYRPATFTTYWGAAARYYLDDSATIFYNEKNWKTAIELNINPATPAVKTWLTSNPNTGNGPRSNPHGFKLDDVFKLESQFNLGSCVGKDWFTKAAQKFTPLWVTGISSAPQANEQVFWNLFNSAFGGATANSIVTLPNFTTVVRTARGGWLSDSDTESLKTVWSKLAPFNGVTTVADLRGALSTNQQFLFWVLGVQTACQDDSSWRHPTLGLYCKDIKNTVKFPAILTEGDCSLYKEDCKITCGECSPNEQALNQLLGKGSPDCKDDATWSSLYGDCTSYSSTNKNHNYCQADGATTPCKSACNSCGNNNSSSAVALLQLLLG